MSDLSPEWYRIANAADVASPAVLVYPERIDVNIRRMLAWTGGPERLFPHVKTHKLPEVVRLQQAHGIRQFKCATIAEAEMVGACGAERVLLAYQPVGPTVRRLLDLMSRFPATRFAAIVDDVTVVREIAATAQARGMTVELLVDLDSGMQRTGITPGPGAEALYRLLTQLPGVTAGGLHAYDGHIHDADLETRRLKTMAAFQAVQQLRERLIAQGLSVPRVVAGGTPTFPIHAREHDVECSPGTCLLMDANYAALMPEAGFGCAAAVLTRIVSKPAANRLCLDLGHKAIASEKPHPRVQLFGLPDAVAVGHSEEHLVLETPRAAAFNVGDVLYGLPGHICPTMALHDSVSVVTAGRAQSRWKVVARDRTLTV